MSDQPQIPPPPPPPPGIPGAAPAYQAPPVTNGMAVAALITGIIGVVLFWTFWVPIILGILAIVFGAVAKGRANQGAPNGTMAVVGLVLGIVAILGAIAMILLVVNVFTESSTTFEEVGIKVGGLILRG